MKHRGLSAALAAFKARHGGSKTKTVTGSVLGDMVVFPPADAGFPARHAIAGISPHTDAIIDTTTVRGVGLAHLNLDPLAEHFCAGLDHGHDHDGDGDGEG